MNIIEAKVCLVGVALGAATAVNGNLAVATLIRFSSCCFYIEWLIYLTVRSRQFLLNATRAGSRSVYARIRVCFHKCKGFMRNNRCPEERHYCLAVWGGRLLWFSPLITRGVRERSAYLSALGVMDAVLNQWNLPERQHGDSRGVVSPAGHHTACHYVACLVHATFLVFARMVDFI